MEKAGIKVDRNNRAAKKRDESEPGIASHRQIAGAATACPRRDWIGAGRRFSLRLRFDFDVEDHLLVFYCQPALV